MNKDKFNTGQLSKYFPAVISLAAIIVYAKTFFYNIIFLDDHINVYEQTAGSSNTASICKAFQTNYLANHYYRPLTVISFIVNSVMNGTSPLIYHVTNVLIHIAASITVYFLLNKLNYSRIISLFAALLFTLTPLQINAVGWISGRADLLAGLFSFCSLFFFLGIKDSLKPANALLVLLLVIFAILSKETTLVVPFLFLLYITIFPDLLPAIKHKILLIISILCVFIIYMFTRALIAATVHIDKFSVVTLIANLPSIAETVFKFFIPLGIKALPDYSTVLSISGFVFLIFLFALPYYLKSINKKVYYFGLTWFILLMLPGMLFTTMSSNGFFYWDCRSYTASLGLVLVAAEIFKLLKSEILKNYFLPIAVIYLILLALTSSYYVQPYQNALTYWTSVSNDYPERYLPHVQLYNYYSFKGDTSNCENELLKAISLEPGNITNRSTLAEFYIKNSRFRDAFQEALEGLKYNTDPDELSLIPYLTRASGKLRTPGQLDNLISARSQDKIILSRLREIFSSEAQNFLKENDAPAYNILTIRIQKVDSLLNASQRIN